VAAPPDVSHVSDYILAIGALGTAAFGLVDATKAFSGGISRVGFGYILKALAPFEPALAAALGSAKDQDWRSVLRAHWINGRDATEQKSIAVSLIQLGLRDDESVAALAAAGHVDPDRFGAAIKALIAGETLTPEQMNQFGRFKASVEARIDAAYERADQAYRNAARLLAGVVAILLALAAAQWLYPGTSLLRAFFIGLIAVPLAPIAKDLAAGLASAAKAVALRIAP
jgi:hypothetical protein